jgi:hypothetical protein
MKICKKLTVIQLIKNLNVIGFKCEADKELISDVESIDLQGGYATITLHNKSEHDFKFEDFKLIQESIIL